MEFDRVKNTLEETSEQETVKSLEEGSGLRGCRVERMIRKMDNKNLVGGSSKEFECIEHGVNWKSY